jgi:transcription termination/antitermination protein NusG
MPFYAIQVRTGGEARFLQHARRPAEAGAGAALVWPRRNLRIRRAGTWSDSLAPVFPGYLFVRAARVDEALFAALRPAPGFLRFLPSNDRIQPLGPGDQQLLSHFLSFGEILDRSLVRFDEDRRIRVVSGPLKGLEGRIVRVDRRKQRARVRLEMYEDSFEIDFGFERLEDTAPGAAPPG